MTVHETPGAAARAQGASRLMARVRDQRRSSDVYETASMASLQARAMATTASTTASTTTPSSISTMSTSTRVGYARVSTREQNPDAQHDALTADGCTKVFTDHASGTLAHRPALAEALGYLRTGDTLVVTKLDRLGRSVKNLKDTAEQLDAAGVGLRAISQGIDTTTPGGRLFFHMLAAIAEFEHDLVVERTREGLAAARARGRRGGGVVKMTATKAAQARLMYNAGGHTVAQIAETFGVSRATVYRHLAES